MQNAFAKLIKLFEVINFQGKEAKLIKKINQFIKEHIFYRASTELLKVKLKNVSGNVNIFLYDSASNEV